MLYICLPLHILYASTRLPTYIASYSIDIDICFAYLRFLVHKLLQAEKTLMD